MIVTMASFHPSPAKPSLKLPRDDRLMVDLIGEIAPTEAQRHALLVDNPERFYGFE